MRIATVVLVAFSTVSGCHAEGPRAPRPGELLIRDVTIVSPERSAPLPHADVLVRDGRIASIGPTGGAREAAGVTVIDGAGRFLIPGLIDGHVHLAEVPGVRPEDEAAMKDVVEAYYRQLPRSWLYFGFTTVVDLNVVDRARLDALRAAPLGPAVFDCGGGLTVPNGYPMSLAPPEIRFRLFSNFLWDERRAGDIPAGFSAAEHTPAAAVARVAQSGGVCVKAFWESGFGADRGKLPVPTEAMMREVLAEARRHHLPLLLHANSLSAHRFAAAIPVDAVVHGLWNWEDAESAGPELPEPIVAAITAERKAGVAQMPTTRVLGGLADLFSPTFLDDPNLRRVLPASLLAWYRSDAGHWFGRELAAGFDGLPPGRIQAIFDRGQRAAAAVATRFVADGGRLLFGSDTPSAPTYANPPGYNAYLELLNLVRGGIPATRVFAAATIDNARFFRIDADYGTVEAGKRASLLVLRANPLDGPAALDTIETVIVGGRAVPRAELAADRENAPAPSGAGADRRR
jgi:imidazolonepropionase-like amidohydrolase